MEEIPPEVLELVKLSIQTLLEAVEKDDHPEHQISYRTMVTTGIVDIAKGPTFQLIVELCTDENHFMKENEILIITDQQYNPEPYKTRLPQKPTAQPIAEEPNYVDVIGKCDNCGKSIKFRIRI